MIRRAILALIFSAALRAGAQDVYHLIRRTNDLAVSTTDKLEWDSGETIKFELWNEWDGTAMSLPTNALVIWAAVDQETMTNFYFYVTGTVENVTNSHMVLWLTSEQSALDPNVDYYSRVMVYQTAGTSNIPVRTAHAATLDVKWSVEYRGYTVQGIAFSVAEAFRVAASNLQVKLDSVVGFLGSNDIYWLTSVLNQTTNDVDAIKKETNAYATAFAWGNHSDAGYLTRTNEAPVQFKAGIEFYPEETVETLNVTDEGLVYNGYAVVDRGGAIHVARLVEPLAAYNQPGVRAPYIVPYALNILLSPTNGIDQSIYATGPITNLVLTAATTNDARRIMLHLWTGTNTIAWSSTNITGLAAVTLSATNVNTVLFLSPPYTTVWRARQ